MAHSTPHAEETNAPWLDSGYWPQDEHTASIPQHWMHQAQPQTAPTRPQRTVIEVGSHGLNRRLIVSASTETLLAETIQAARLKGWEIIEMYEGIDPSTGWPTVWMQKPVMVVPAQSTPTAQSESHRDSH